MIARMIAEFAEHIEGGEAARALCARRRSREAP